MYPQITLSVENDQRLRYGDTLVFRFAVQDYEEPVRVTVLEGAREIPFVTNRLSKTGADFVYQIYVTDRYIESGRYSIRVSAQNGEAGSSAFLTLIYTGLEKKITGFAALEVGGRLHLADTNRVFIPLSLEKPFRKLCFNSRYQLLYALENGGELRGLRAGSLEEVFRREEASSFDQGFQNLVQAEGETYLLKRQGVIEQLNATGGSKKRISLPANRQPIQLSAYEDVLFCLASVNEQGNTGRELLLINEGTGATTGSLFLPGGSRDISTLSKSECLILDYSGGISSVYYFRRNDMSLTKLFEIPENFKGVLATPKGHAILYGSAGIYRFSPQSNLQPVLLAGFPIDALFMDALSGNYLVSSGFFLQWVNANTGESQVFLRAAAPLTDGAILYNK